jgi:hypothetical protein
MITDLLAGSGSDADFLNLFGDNYEANQSAYDVADNGGVSTTNDVTTVTSPGWFSSLTSVLNQGVQLAGTVGTVAGIFTDKPGKTSAAKNTAANTTPGAGAASGLKSFLPWIIGGIVAVAGLVLLLRK